MITKLFRNACKITFLALAIGIAFAADAPEAAIREVMDKQSAAWNRGNLETFVSYYDSQATFVGETVTRGTSQLLDRYKKRYPTPARMGKLTFSDLEIRLLGSDHALVVGKWRLDREAAGGGPAGGIYSLVFRKTAAGWKIMHDHTS